MQVEKIAQSAPARAASRTAPASKTRPAVLALIVLLVGGTAGLLLCEAAVRIFAPQSLISDVIVGDPDVDYRLRPNARGRMSSPEYSADIRINSLGFRGPEIAPAKKPGVLRVLFLGDSFVFGHGLKEDETLPAVVARELERSYPGKFEVVNGGVYGYSTADELNFYKKFGAPLAPDVVVTVLILYDMNDNLDGYRLDGAGRLVRQHTSSDYNSSRRITRFIPGADWLRAHSHLFKFVGVRVLPVLASGAAQNSGGGDQPAAPGGLAAEFYSPEFYRAGNGAFAVTQALLAELAASARKDGARSILLTIAGNNEIQGGSVAPRAMLPHEQLKRAALGGGFSRAMALPALLARYRGGENLFFPKDGHWTAAATRFVAPDVAAAIAETADGK